jgi:hypothetical protein
MTAEITDDPTADATLSDPTTLLDREDVDVRDRHETADDEQFADHESWAGMAVVGITDDDGRLLLLRHEDDDHAILPHRPVEPGDDYAAVAREAAAEAADLQVTLDSVERVRRVEFSHADDDARTTRRFDVLFRASLDGDGTPTSERDCWTATWAREVPDNPDWDHEDVLSDIRAFLG